MASDRFTGAKNDIVSLLRQESDTYITTMFDFYAMPESWPGRTEAKNRPHDAKAVTIEEAILRLIGQELKMSFDSRRLIPYIQMHEFEALLFSDPSKLSQVMRIPESEKYLRKIRDAFTGPEEINDNANTAPSKRIKNIFGGYRKPFHGRLAATRVTIETMRRNVHISMTGLRNLKPLQK